VRVALVLRQIRFGRVDLVVAVTCLCLLAVVAVPRHLDISAANRRTEVRALAAGIESAAELGHSLWSARGQPSRIAIAGTPVAVINGYPSPADLARLLEEAESTAFAFANGTWQHRERTAARPCGVTYAPPARGGEKPLIRAHFAGC
jgi:type II secretory pathway pseudopilin PulG